jgi:hypothetical protein
MLLEKRIDGVIIEGRLGIRRTIGMPVYLQRRDVNRFKIFQQLMSSDWQTVRELALLPGL